MREHARTAPSRTAVLALACAAQFMVVLDVSVVNVALPPIRESLGFTSAGVQWVAGAYALAFAGFLLLGGRLADLYGRAQVFTAGLVLFTAASLVGGLADTPGLLVTARAAQGLGAAVIAPATLTLVTTTFTDGPERVRALAVWTAVSLAGGATGNLVGGALTHVFSWRSVLLINVPIGLFALLGTVRRSTDEHRRPATTGSLDVPGALAGTTALTALVYGLTRASEHGWADPWTATALTCGGVVLAGFIAVEFRAPTPLLPPRLLGDRATGVGTALMALSGACLQIPMWFFLAFHMHDVLGFTALETGLGFLPHTLVTMIVGRYTAPWLMERVQARLLIAIGALVTSAGFAWQASALSADTYLGAIVGPAVVISVGAGLSTTPLTAVITSGAHPEDAGAVSGLLNTAKQAGGALGLALLTTLIVDRNPASSEGHEYALVFWPLAAIQAVVVLLSPALPSRSPTGGREGAR